MPSTRIFLRKEKLFNSWNNELIELWPRYIVCGLYSWNKKKIDSPLDHPWFGSGCARQYDSIPELLYPNRNFESLSVYLGEILL